MPLVRGPEGEVWLIQLLLLPRRDLSWRGVPRSWRRGGGTRLVERLSSSVGNAILSGEWSSEGDVVSQWGRFGVGRTIVDAHTCQRGLISAPASRRRGRGAHIG